MRVLRLHRFKFLMVKDGHARHGNLRETEQRQVAEAARTQADAQTLVAQQASIALKREVEKILQDVRDGLVSVERAREDYGVVIDPVGLVVDREATGRLRSGGR